MSIHARIKEGRLRLKLTEQQFADQVGVTRAAVQQWERENGTAPRRSKQEKVAQVLGISVAELVTGAAAPESDAATLPAIQRPTPLEVPTPSTMAEALQAISQLVQQLQVSCRVGVCKMFCTSTTHGHSRALPETSG